MKKKKKVFIIFLVLLLMMGSILPVFADIWDGSSLPIKPGGSSGTATPPDGKATIPYTSNQTICGYRFSFYDGTGTKLGNSIDIGIRNPAQTTGNFYFSKTPQSHIELYDQYLQCQKTGGSVSIGSGEQRHNFNYGVDLINTVGTDPSKLGAWLMEGKYLDKLKELCSVSTFDDFTGRIVVEPMFEAQVGNVHHALTIAEAAVLQSRYMGWNSTTSDGNYSYIAEWMGSIFPRTLFATNSYTGFSTVPPTADNGCNTNKWTGSHHEIALPHHDGWRNQANEILQYQVGMGVFTTNSRIRFRVEDPNGNPVQGYWGKLFWYGNQDVTQGYSDVNGEIGRLSVNMAQEKDI